jgi:transcriptional regulator with PAS, ATPase and Fis domain
VVTETIEFGATSRSRRLSFVLVIHKEGASQRHPIEGTLLVGKHPENDVVLDLPGISRYHLELRPEPDRVLVRDVGSKNGTFFDGARITEVRIGAGAMLRVGGPAGLEMSIELAEQPALAPSQADHFGPLIGSSRAMRSLFAVLERTAATNTTILIVGETGTGKELVAQAVHETSPRKGPFIVVDCGAIPHHLVESELFGHKRGAFTDAHSDRAGAFEAAHGGTLFLDEIGELPIELQPKLLRAVESRAIQRIGETTRRPVDVRLIAATNRNLESEISAGRFRQDLFFRLAVVTVSLPPLRERGDDVLSLAKHIMTQLGRADAFDLSGPIAQAMLAYSWPGNVRELRNAIERAIHLGAEHAIPMASNRSAPETRSSEAAPDLPFKEAKEQIVGTFERAYLERLLSRHANNISAAARDAGIDRNYLYRLIKKHELE